MYFQSLMWTRQSTITHYGLQNYKEFRSPPNYFESFLLCVGNFDGLHAQLVASLGFAVLIADGERGAAGRSIEGAIARVGSAVVDVAGHDHFCHGLATDGDGVLGIDAHALSGFIEGRRVAPLALCEVIFVPSLSVMVAGSTALPLSQP